MSSKKDETSEAELPKKQLKNKGFIKINTWEKLLAKCLVKYGMTTIRMIYDMAMQE